MNIVGRRKIWFAISLLIMIPGLVFLALFGLNSSIEFTGGSRLLVAFPSEVTGQQQAFIRENLEKNDVKVVAIEKRGSTLVVRTSTIDQKINSAFTKELAREYKESKIVESSTIGPTIGRETTINAIKAVVVASILVVIYITLVFRKVPKPASSIKFGVTTVVALVHDVLVVVGVFAILGYFLNVEVDSLFVTALLTVIGFSVHDTIVVFDRIRENLEKKGSDHFETTVNESILQTIGRSLNTSITVLLVLFALLLFGGESIRWFVVALMVGMLSGTYSSIFTAAPILVVWHNWSLKRSRNKK
jgi:preprotein translocase subunit SecF